jgi:UDP-N-acetylglucosamine 2-epimerase (non-hydrolysing)
MGKPTVMTIVGTRPEIIRLSETIKRFDQVFKHELVHTGQNDHAKLKDVFFEDLGLRQPDHYLNVDTSSFGSVMADTIRSCEKLFGTTKPDAVVVLGDTNSAISLLVARRMAIPTYHLEAGNRSFE